MVTVCHSQAVSKRANCSDVNHYNAAGMPDVIDWSCAQLVAGGQLYTEN